MRGSEVRHSSLNGLLNAVNSTGKQRAFFFRSDSSLFWNQNYPISVRILDFSEQRQGRRQNWSKPAILWESNLKTAVETTDFG